MAGPAFFATRQDLHDWLLANHDKAGELDVGFFKVGSGRPSITYREALDEALCFGWIDGVRRGIDGESYRQRFTPRASGSFWSAVNTKRALELLAAGRLQPSGLAAFEARDEARTQRRVAAVVDAALDGALEDRFRANRGAWAFFQKQPASYRKLMIAWITGATRDQTRHRRLDLLVADSAAGRRIDPLRPGRPSAN